jgi:outer membrane autotransporter protein
MRRIRYAVLLSCCYALPSHANNPALQQLFFSACNGATGALAARCAETPDAQGDLSGDSERSLNPSQILSGNMAGVEAAQAKAKQARERALGGEVAEAPQLTMGPFSLLLNARYTDEERWKDALQDRERGYEMSQTALEVGLDYRASDNLVWGGLLSYGTGTMDFMGEAPGVNFTPADQAGKVDRDSYGIALFAAYAYDSGAYVDVAAGYDWDDLKLERRSVFQETTRTVAQTDSFTRGSTDGRQWWMAVNGGMDWSQGAYGYGVYGGLTYTDSKVDGFQEEDVSGTGLAMSMGSVERTSVLGRIGVRGQRAISTTQGVLLPYMRVEYEHEFDGEADSTRASYVLDANGNQLVLGGDSADDGHFNVGLGMVAIMPNGWMPFIDVDALVGESNWDRYRVALGLRKEF